MTYPEMKKALQEREQKYLSNMAWLDHDLERLVEEDERKKKIYEENLAWLDKDLTDKIVDDEMVRTVRAFEESMALASKPGEQLVRQPLHEVPVRNASKIWHCGHKIKQCSDTSDEDWNEHREWFKNEIDVGRDQCVVLHNTNSGAKSTHAQLKKFIEQSRPGDIIFRHTQAKMTHYGYLTGEAFTVSRHTIHPNERDGEMVTRIPVEKWMPLPEALKGTGRNSTLYEVKPESNNYQNYSIMS